MTQAVTQVYTDLDDLVLLDDQRAHAFCPGCVDFKLGVPFIALCGRRAIAFGGTSVVIVPHSCPECEPLVSKPCTRPGCRRYRP